MLALDVLDECNETLAGCSAGVAQSVYPKQNLKAQKKPTRLLNESAIETNYYRKLVLC